MRWNGKEAIHVSDFVPGVEHCSADTLLLSSSDKPLILLQTLQEAGRKRVLCRNRPRKLPVCRWNLCWYAGVKRCEKLIM
jgi:hypothetical protein